jgi:hypothetical protein
METQQLFSLTGTINRITLTWLVESYMMYVRIDEKL